MEETDDETNTGEVPEISFTGGQGDMTFRGEDTEFYFFSLSEGRMITAQEEIESQSWDIAFRPPRLILTNSGVTAGKYWTGGKGGVWHTNQTDFDAVTSRDDAVTDDPVYTPAYNTDVTRYAYSMAVADSSFVRAMNVMTFIGYGNENEPGAGLSGDKRFDANYRYNKKAFYANVMNPATDMGVMPPDFYVTNQVYIIRHGDGEHYSKFQVTQYIRHYDNGYFALSSDTFSARWEVLE
jgi:hypothetical protein